MSSFPFFKKKRYKYDAFISHAFEDQVKIVNELQEKLRKKGIRVWYSGIDMPVGEELYETIIEDVIPACRWGIVVISKDFFSADWARQELNELYRHESVRKAKIILPVWHDVDVSEVQDRFPYLAGRFAVRSDIGMDQMVDRLSRKIGGVIPRARIPILLGAIRKWLIGYWEAVTFAILVVAIIALIIIYYDKALIYIRSNKDFEVRIERRIQDVNGQVRAYHNDWLYKHHAEPADIDRLIKMYPDKKCGRRVYKFSNLTMDVSGRKKVAEAGVEINDVFGGYGIREYALCIDTKGDAVNYALLNTGPVTYEIIDVQINESQAVVRVAYKNALRLVLTNMNISRVKRGCMDQQVFFYGFRPVEEYVFERKQNKWGFIAITNK